MINELTTLFTPFDGSAQNYADMLCERVYRTLCLGVGARPDRSEVERVATTRLWTPEAGVLATALRESKYGGSVETVAVQLAVLEAIGGIKTSLDTCIDAEFPLRAEGVDYPIGPLAVCIDDDEICIRAKDRIPEQPRFVEVDEHRVQLVQSTHWMKVWLGREMLVESSAHELAFEKIFVNVIETLAKYAPEYVEWTSLLLREVTPLKSAGEGSNSSSFIGFPGHIHMSVPHSTSAGTVTLIHECSHQFFQLIEWNLRVVANDEYAVYSVLKARRRPLSRVLLGYHAFVNALTALALMGDRGYFDSDFSRVYEHTRKLVSNLSEALEEVAEEHYAPAGLAMYKRLRDVDRIVRS